MIIDSHAHLNFEAFDDDWEEVIKDCLGNDVWFICVGAQYETSKRAVKLADTYDEGVWAAVSLHPIHVEGSSFHPEKFIPLVINKILSEEKIQVHANSDKTKAGSRFYIHARNVADGYLHLVKKIEAGEKIVGEDFVF